MFTSEQAENAAAYLVMGSHINVVSRVQNNNYERDGERVYAMAFTAEEIDYLDSKAEGDALRSKKVPAPQEDVGAPTPEPAAKGKPTKPRKSSAAATRPAFDEQGDPIPF